jgi:hypothetical protein
MSDYGGPHAPCGMGRIDSNWTWLVYYIEPNPYFGDSPDDKPWALFCAKIERGPKETYDARLAAGKHEHTGWTYTTKRAADRCNSR